MWYLTSQKSGGSALGLQQVLGLGSYQTAWSWLHKLRRAMVRPDRDRLNGCVEVDDTYVGGEEEDVRGRQTEEKAIVVVAAEQDGRGIGRIRLRRVPDVSSPQGLSPVNCGEPGCRAPEFGARSLGPSLALRALILVFALREGPPDLCITRARNPARQVGKKRRVYSTIESGTWIIIGCPERPGTR